MKKIVTLLSIVGILMVPFTTINAQDDVTPARYVFENVPAGPYSMDYQFAASNVPNQSQIIKDNWNFGFVAIGSTRMINSLEFDDGGEGEIINSMFQIYDMGGEVGKVLMMKENVSNFEFGEPGLPGYSNSWFNQRWYAPKDGPTVQENLDAGDDAATALQKATIRFRIVFHVYQNELNFDGRRFFNVLGYNWQGGYKSDDTGTALNGPTFRSGDFTDEDGNYDPDKWLVHEYDFVAYQPNELPLSFNLAFHEAQGATLLIKEIKMIANPEGDPVETGELTMSWGDATAISEVEKQPGFNAYTGDGQLYLEEVRPGSAVTVYSVTGQIVESFNAEASAVSVPLSFGAYIVKVGKATRKVIVN